MGVADESGKIIISPKYKTIAYFPSLNDQSKTLDTNTNKLSDRHTKVFIPTAPATFLTTLDDNEKWHAIYDLSGNLLRDSIDGVMKLDEKGYWEITKKIKTSPYLGTGQG